MSDLRDLLLHTAGLIAEYRETLPDHPVAPTVQPGRLSTALGGPMPASGLEPAAVIDQLVAATAPGLVASAGPRSFGFVAGGAPDSAPCAGLLAAGGGPPRLNPGAPPGGATP